MSLLREKAAAALSVSGYDALFAKLVAEKRTSAPCPPRTRWSTPG